MLYLNAVICVEFCPVAHKKPLKKQNKTTKKKNRSKKITKGLCLPKLIF